MDPALEPTPGPAAEEAVVQYVTFFIAEECFAFPLASVLEIIRVPETVKVPLAPASLLGLASLRGSVLPVLDLRSILALPPSAHGEATRVMVTDVGTPVGLVVDRVAQVLTVERSTIESSQSVRSTVRAELLTGVVKGAAGRSLIQLLEPALCVGQDFASMVKAGRQADAQGEVAGEETEDDSAQIVSFVVDGQEYAFPISQIEEIVRVPDEVSRVPRADRNVLGLINLRNRLLPLVGMRRILGLPDADLGDAERVLVVRLGGAGDARESVGIVVDQVREVLRVAASDRDPVPALLSRSGSETRIESVCRLEGGTRLVSVLSSQALLDHQVVQAAVTTSRGSAVTAAPGGGEDAGLEDDENRVVVFQLASQEYGVLVESVQEIIRVPPELSRVPRTDESVEGMVNLRGAVLPVIDLRTRFGLARAERSDRQRILVFNQAGTCTGFVVDSVYEVLRFGHDALEDAPRLSAEQARLMGKVANLAAQKRMIQILDVAALVGPAEIPAAA